jgi:hypothetical protein
MVIRKEAVIEDTSLIIPDNLAIFQWGNARHLVPIVRLQRM